MFGDGIESWIENGIYHGQNGIGDEEACWNADRLMRYTCERSDWGGWWMDTKKRKDEIIFIPSKYFTLKYLDIPLI